VPNDPHRDAFLQLVERRPIIDGRFSNPRRIDPRGGAGNFSLVFIAQDNQTNRNVVLKFFHPGMLQDSYRWQSFQREAELLAKLAGQRDIIQLVASRSQFVEVLSANGLSLPIQFSYYAVEQAFCDVETALDNAPVSAEEALEFFHHMCRAVQRIRGQRIAHRDLKPRNFLLMPTGEVKLSDFGTARCYEGGAALLNHYVYPPGDTRYCPPEMLAGLHDEVPEMALDADLYALGAILFELLTGTNLGATILSTKMMQDLSWTVSRVRRGERKHVFDAAIAGLAAAYPLPRLSDFGSVAPGSIVPLAEDLYRSLAALDYRARQKDFDRIFLKIQTCLIVLRNSEKYERWQREKEKRRDAVKAKSQRLEIRS
jgi:serine/threonine protein kinase